MSIDQVINNKASEKNKKLIYIEGIRGMAAFMVVIHHYLLAFYPAHANGLLSDTHFSSLEMWYYKSPFTFFANGHFYVYIFFILSGYVLSKKFLKEKSSEYLVSASIRRFFRLYLPVAFALIVAYCVLIGSLNSDTEAGILTKSLWMKSLKEPSDFIHFLKNLIYKAMLWGENTYITVLWTISIELYGSFLVYASLALTKNIKNILFVFFVLFAVLFLFRKFEYCAFILGVFLNYTNDYKFERSFFKKIVVGLCLIIGLFLGGFPHIDALSQPSIKGTFYAFLDYSFIMKMGSFINSIGALLVVLAIQQSLILQRLFETKGLIFLGYVSFSLYLIHIIILRSLSSYIFVKAFPILGYNVSFLVTFISSVTILFFASFYMTIYIDTKSVKLSQYIYNQFFRRV